MNKNIIRALAAVFSLVALFGANVSHASTPIITGRVYNDENKNGKWDSNEIGAWVPVWYKVTDGGGWYVCGVTAGEKYGSSYGVPIDPLGGYKDFPENYRNEGGTYYVLPIAPAGYSVTTPKIVVKGFSLGTAGAGLSQDIGIVKDGNTKLDACDQYNPVR